ncbi:hypothetical protein [Spirosoma aerophilum]
MSNYLIFSTLVLMAACQSRKPDQAATESTQTQPTQETALATTDTLCFQQVMSRDTTTLQLVMNGQQVSGYLDNNPYEKDRARGNFQGTVDNNTIRADWERSGEGTTQVYPIDFSLQGDTISWYEGERVEQQGKWVLKDPKAGYRYVLTKTNCQ